MPVSGSGWNNNIVVNGARQPDNVNFNSRERRLFQDDGNADAAWPSLRRARTRRRRKKWRSSPKGSRSKYFRESEPDRPGLSNRGRGSEQPRPFYEIVGVVKDTKYTDLREPFTPLAFYAVAGT